ELQESEERFRALFESAPVAYMSLTSNGHIVEINSEWEHLLGYNRENVLGKSFHDFLLPYSIDLYTSNFENSVHSGSIHNAEYEIRRSNSSVATISLEGRVWSDKSGAFKQTHCLLYDVGERKHSEELLRNSEKMLRESQSIAGLGSFIFDIVKDQWSSSAILNEIFGIDEGYTRSFQGWAALIHPASREQLIEYFNTEVLQKKKRFDKEYKIIRVSDGAERWVHGMGELKFDHRGAPIQLIGSILDITERKHAEEVRLLQTTALDSAANGVVITDLGGNIVWVNKAFVKMTGYGFDEVVGKNPRLLKSGIQNNSYYTNLWSTIADGNVWSGEVTNRRKDGTLYTEEMTITPVRGTTDNITHYVAVKQDITERKLAEERLQVSEISYKGILNSVSEAIYVQDEKGRFMDVNRAAEEMYDYTREELLGKTPEFLSAPGKNNLAASAVALVKAFTGTPQYFEFWGKRKDGTIFPKDVSLNATTYFGRRAVVAVARDITEQRRSYEHIKEQAALLAEAHDAIVLLSTEYTILYWNKGAEHTYGWHENEIIGKDIREILFKNVQDYTEAFQTLQTSGNFIGELHHRTKNGSELIVDVRLGVLRDSDGKPKSILSIATDVTEQKKLETQFLRAQRLESLGTLAGGVAHDLNNVLAPILLSIEVLKRLSNDEKALKLYELLEATAKRGSDIVKQILSFARGLEGSRTNVQPRHIIREILTIIKEIFPRSITITEQLSPDLWMITGDPTQFHQLIMNLCLNARDAMPNGGTLILSAENKIIDEQYSRMNIQAKPGRYMMLSIADSGIGMSPEILDRIFEPFFTTKEIGKGTGLGLSTVHTIVKSYGGFVDVESVPGKGTSFKVYLPASEALVAEEKDVDNQNMLQGHGECILVVDDEVSICEITRETLETFGYTTFVAHDGTEAVALFASHKEKIAAVLTDMMMPLMDGAHLIRA
ncbi:MAG: PAS domain S-box protein, partial [Bacteroidota bacterium]|nr:PAS domain S-box protein [Bacteroidota bacterium]